jgi:hypothetical protein
MDWGLRQTPKVSVFGIDAAVREIAAAASLVTWKHVPTKARAGRRAIEGLPLCSYASVVQT